LAKRQGDPVARDEIVATLENPTLADEYTVRRAQLGETAAQLRLGEKQLERQEQLFAQKLVSAQQVEDGRLALAVTRARLDASRVQVARLKEQLERMVIRSPIAGQVVSAALELGQWITPNQPLFEIYNYDEYEVLVGVPGRLLALMPASGDAEVLVPEFSVSLQGEILAVVRHVNTQTGNFTLRVRVANRDGLPLSGMLARVRLPMGQARRILTVPRDAVVRNGEQTHVVLVSEDGKAQIVPVQVQGNFGGAVIVTGQGLDDGAVVVVRGNERLFPGTPVRVAGDQSNHAPG
jgi:RND family efflux transporter MFP subunit